MSSEPKMHACVARLIRIWINFAQLGFIMLLTFKLALEEKLGATLAALIGDVHRRASIAADVRSRCSKVTEVCEGYTTTLMLRSYARMETKLDDVVANLCSGKRLGGHISTLPRHLAEKQRRLLFHWRI